MLQAGATFTTPFKLYTNASALGLGAVLTQKLKRTGHLLRQPPNPMRHTSTLAAPAGAVNDTLIFVVPLPSLPVLSWLADSADTGDTACISHTGGFFPTDSLDSCKTFFACIARTSYR